MSIYDPRPGDPPTNLRVLLTDTTRYSNAPRLAIELSKLGITVSAICPERGHPIQKVHQVRQIIPYSSLRPLDLLLRAVKISEPTIIVPFDECAVQHLHELYSSVRQLGKDGNNVAALIERSLSSPESYTIVSSRHALLQIARQEGLRVPDTKLVRTVGEVKAWRQGQTLPCVLKADGTWGGRGVKTAHTVEQAENYFCN